MKVSEHHSWVVKELGKELEALAISRYGIEADMHRTKPIYGTQFHSEIKWRNDGYKCLENFLQMIK